MVKMSFIARTVNELIWLSVNRFSTVTGERKDKIIEACKNNKLIAEREPWTRAGNYRISVLNLTASQYQDYIFESIFSFLFGRDVADKNLTTYKNLKPFQREYVDRWLTIFKNYESRNRRGVRRGTLAQFCSTQNTSVATFLLNKRLWLNSNGDIDSITPGYGGKKSHKNNSRLNTQPSTPSTL
jgi:hypothetical protein